MWRDVGGGGLTERRATKLIRFADLRLPEGGLSSDVGSLPMRTGGASRGRESGESRQAIAVGRSMKGVGRVGG
jgi:hypothetical protein